MGTIGSQFLAEDFEECIASVQKAEEAGYSHAWFVDSQLLWQDCFVYMTHALARDRADRRRHAPSRTRYTRHVHDDREHVRDARRAASRARRARHRPRRQRRAHDGPEPGQDRARSRSPSACCAS